MTIGELLDVAESVAEDEKRLAEDRYFLVAWQTSHLMNASGNLKKAMTPDKLLGRKSQKAAPTRYESKEAKLQALDALKKQFEQ